jgi:hypothetical protein
MKSPGLRCIRIFVLRRASGRPGSLLKCCRNDSRTAGVNCSGCSSAYFKTNKSAERIIKR